MSGFIPKLSDFSLYDNVIRLHVIANSDSEYDQQLKLFVRDSIIDCVGQTLDGAATKEEAEAAITASLSDITVKAETAIYEYGSDYTVSAALSPEEYPRRTYGNVTLPAGEYTSLRIVIGDGDGQNWWCVLFPRLCASPALEYDCEDKDKFIEAGFTPSQYKIMTDTDDTRYVVKFRIVEFFRGVINKWRN